jgi:hypothetical protein
MIVHAAFGKTSFLQERKRRPGTEEGQAVKINNYL